MSTTFQTFRVGLDPDGEDRFIPFSPESFGAAITESTVDGDFDFPIDFEYTAQGAFWSYSYIPDYMRVTSAGRVQYYFLTPLSVTAPKYDAENIALVRPLKFAAHKDVCATFHTEYLKYANGSRIYQGHYLGGFTRNDSGTDTACAPDWKQTPRYMPYHFDEIQRVNALFTRQEYAVIVYFTRKATGTKSFFVTYDPIYYLWGYDANSVGEFIFGLINIGAFGDTQIESIDDVRVIPRQVIENSALYAAYGVSQTVGVTINGHNYVGIIGNDSLSGTLSVFTAYDIDDVINVPEGSRLAYEVGAGSSWIRIPPRVYQYSENGDRQGGEIGFQLYFGAGGTFQLIMEVYNLNSLQSIDLSQYCSVPFYWMNSGDKASQTTAAALQTLASVLGTAASVALAVPTGGASLVGAVAGVAGTASGIVGTIDAAEKPAPTTTGAGSFPGAFVSRSPDTLSPVLGFPLVRIYTTSYADDIGAEMRGAYTANPAGEPFYLSINAQREFFTHKDDFTGAPPSLPYYMYIKADAVPVRTKATEDLQDNNTDLMSQSDLDNFKSLLARGVRLWFNVEKYVPGSPVKFREYTN